METRRSKVSQIPDPPKHAKLSLRELFGEAAGARGLKAMARAKACRQAARTERNLEARKSLLTKAKRHDFQVECAAASRWLRD